MYNVYEHAIAVTDRQLVSGDFLTQIAKVAALHPHALILREKDLNDTEYERLAADVLRICNDENVACFMHSRVETAQNLGCRNIHMPVNLLTEMNLAERARLTTHFDNISVSCHSKEDVCNAKKCGATQIILGTIFETDCKKGLKGKGLEFVREICAYCSLPVYAIGGMNPDRIKEVIAVGAAGGCMMSGFMKM